MYLNHCLSVGLPPKQQQLRGGPAVYSWRGAKGCSSCPRNQPCFRELRNRYPEPRVTGPGAPSWSWQESNPHPPSLGSIGPFTSGPCPCDFRLGKPDSSPSDAAARAWRGPRGDAFAAMSTMSHFSQTWHHLLPPHLLMSEWEDPKYAVAQPPQTRKLRT